MLDAVIRQLQVLVSFDTRNPPRLIGTGGIFEYVRSQLPDFHAETIDHGDGAISLFVVRGNPDCVFNVHLDTVPASPEWSADPLALRVADGRATGLGACDIKGAAACLIAAAQAVRGDAAFLFSSDEEANDARCIEAFLRRPHGFDRVVVAEPTNGRAVLAHRGISSVQLRFKGHAGHASGADAIEGSAIHHAMRWGARSLEFVQGESHRRFGGLTGLRFNIGRVEGGIKANVIAPAAEVRFGFRPLPSHDIDALHAKFGELAEAGTLERYAEMFRGPPLPAGDVATAEERRLAARDFAETLGLPIGNAVDFWTEAALFSQAGLGAIVFGPGDIAQAHTADEWVALEQLQSYADAVTRIIANDVSPSL